MSLNNFREVHLPYCLEKQEDGGYVVLNREYKPLGFAKREHYKYSDYPIVVKIKGLTPSKASEISFKGAENLDKIYLYDNSCLPETSPENMQSYLARLAILSELEFDKFDTE